MLHARSVVLGALGGFVIGSIGVGFGCQKKESKGERPADSAKTVETGDPKPVTLPGLPPQKKADLEAPLAKVDNVTITVGEFQDRINRQSPYIRARYTSLEKKKEFLDNLIRFEVLAKEAFARKFDKHPDVVRTMKQVMIQKLMKSEFENKIKPGDITEAEMRSFYKEHEREYNKPAQVRVSAIILRSKGKAQKVAKEALGDKGRTNKGFRELVGKYSQDEKTKIRGGDLRYFHEQTKDKAIPRSVIAAAFKLRRTGAVAGPINGGNGLWYIIKQTGKRKALKKEFADVKRQIQNRLYREKRTKSQKDFIADLRKKAKIKVYQRNIRKVRVETQRGGKRGHGHGSHAPRFPGTPMKSPGNKAPTAPTNPK